jgi:hypothetical protein
MIDKWDYMKLKAFCMTKEMDTRLKRQLQDCEKIFGSCTSVKGLVTIIYREFKKLNSPQNKDPMKKWLTELNTAFSKEEV